MTLILIFISQLLKNKGRIESSLTAIKRVIRIIQEEGGDLGPIEIYNQPEKKGT